MDRQHLSGVTVVRIVRVSPDGDVVVATVSDVRIVGLVADLALAALPTREPDPILSAIRAGHRTALRRLAGAG
jgi:hypothetical protein